MMLRSLRTRLVLMTVGVAVLAVATVGLLYRRFTLLEFSQYVASSEDSRAARFAHVLSAYYRERGGWDGVQSVLEGVGDDLYRQLFLVDASGRVVAAYPAELLKSEVRVGPGHTLRWTGRGRNGDRLVLEEFILRDVPHAVLEDGRGGPAGTLYFGPPPPGPATNREELFVSGVNRTLLVAALVSTGLALLLSVMLSRGLLKPVEALTAAARRMEKGDLRQRVDAPAGDEIGALARAFNSMADSLARAEQLRRNMVGDVAHELRTPLTNIRCQLETLQDGLAEPTPDFINSLHEEALLLGRLADDLQDLALAEAGQLRMERRRLVVEDEVVNSVGALRGQVESAGLTVTAETPQGTPDVFADQTRLRQVLRNLITNAVTHTPAGGAIKVSARRAGVEVEFKVEDTGQGIAPDALPNVFERFYRADGSRDRATGGAGLGLAIVKQIVTAHGGSVRVDSTVGKGTAVSFTLPGHESVAGDDKKT